MHFDVIVIGIGGMGAAACHHLAKRGLADAARSRSEADWLVGINGTRAMTAFNSRDGGFFLTTVGRVQTPTLALVVNRDTEIERCRGRRPCCFQTGRLAASAFSFARFSCSRAFCFQKSTVSVGFGCPSGGSVGLSPPSPVADVDDVDQPALEHRIAPHLDRATAEPRILGGHRRQRLGHERADQLRCVGVREIHHLQSRRVPADQREVGGRRRVASAWLSCRALP